MPAPGRNPGAGIEGLEGRGFQGGRGEGFRAGGAIKAVDGLDLGDGSRSTSVTGHAQTISSTSCTGRRGVTGDSGP
jgi:hypothetical protein